MKTCVTCQHCKLTHSYSCFRDVSHRIVSVDPVTGYEKIEQLGNVYDCETERSSITFERCGIDAKFWVSRESPPPGWEETRIRSSVTDGRGPG